MRYKTCGFDPWVGKIPWSKKWQPTPIFLPGKSHGQRSLVGYSPGGTKSQTNLRDWTNTHTQTNTSEQTLLPNYPSSVQFSHSVMSDSLRPHESQHSKLPCPSPTPGVYSDSCPSSQWCHPAISSSVVPFSSCPQSLPASESLPMSQRFAWGGQSIGASASASVLPMNTQDWSLGWAGWIFLQSKELKSLLQHHSSKASIFRHSAFFIVQLSHPYVTSGKTIALTRWTFVGKVMSLLF